MNRVGNITDVVEWQLCVGCGACAYICGERKIQLVNIESSGIRPIVSPEGCQTCNDCLKVCPGYDVTHSDESQVKGGFSELEEGWGTVLGIWEGHASDPEIRYAGSSGGVATALALYCIEKEGMYGVLHIGADGQQPWVNKTVMSRNKAELLARTGSRYSPASPCDGLAEIESAPSPCVFIGKPCDVLGVKKAELMKSELLGKIGLSIGFFCAGTPSTQGTIDLLHSVGIRTPEVDEVRYRGRGWPGYTTARLNGESFPSRRVPYKNSWGFLQRYRPFRCHLCPDGTGEFADISCGDPWYREIKEDEAGSSLVMARTEKGRHLVQKAIRAGYLTLTSANPEILEASQYNLLAKRRAVWGRLVAMRVWRVPTPRIHGFKLFTNWCRLSVRDKARSVLGTMKRIVMRKYYKRAVVDYDALRSV